jgi:negative regulator of sigma E activity
MDSADLISKIIIIPKMTKAEQILKETLDLDGEITKKHYTMTLKVGEAIEAINKALSITAVVQAKPEVCEDKNKPNWSSLSPKLFKKLDKWD